MRKRVAQRQPTVSTRRVRSASAQCEFAVRRLGVALCADVIEDEMADRQLARGAMRHRRRLDTVTRAEQ